MEIWKKTFISDDYEVSNMGNFRSLDRYISHGNYSKKYEGKNIKPFKVKSTGYLQIMIKGKKYSAHRLVARAFCEGYSSELVVNHKNGIRIDNRSSNLEWVTNSENIKHTYSVLGTKSKLCGRYGKENNASKKIISIDIKTGSIKKYFSAMDAVREGFTSSQISRCCNGESKFHKGRIWKFGTDAIETIRLAHQYEEQLRRVK